MKRIFSLRVKGAARWTILFAGAVLVIAGTCTVLLLRNAPAVDRYWAKNASGAAMGSFTDEGNLALKGTLTQSQATITPDAGKDEWIVYNSSSVPKALIQMDSTLPGNMYICGTLITGTINLATIEEIFVYKNSAGTPVAAIDTSGNLYLVGTLYENDSDTSLAAPTNLQEELDTNADIMISWNDNTLYEDGYQIYRGETVDNMSLLTTVAANTELYIDQGTTVNTLYYYKVRAYRYYGGNYYYSSFSNIASGLALEVVQCAAP
jgi:hypothetical protein